MIAKRTFLGLKIALLLFGTQSAMAASFNFTGNFSQDDDIQLFNFSVSSITDIILNTSSFAAGGFTPVLTLFDSGNNLIAASLAPSGCGGGNPASPDSATGACWDTYLQFTAADLGQLSVGSYLLALTEYDNVAFGPTLADGFLYAGAGNFTGAGGFWENNLGPDPVQRNNGWAVNLSGVDTAGPVSVAEPTGMALFFLGLASMAASRRRHSA